MIQAAGRLILADQLAIPNTSTASIRAYGEYQGKLTTDDPEQLIHFQRLGKLPLSLAIAVPLADIYAGWQLKAIAMTIVLVIFFGSQ